VNVKRVIIWIKIGKKVYHLKPQQYYFRDYDLVKNRNERNEYRNHKMIFEGVSNQIEKG
jgi:hypothetical protein